MGTASEGSGEALELRETLARMQAALLTLPELDRQLVALAYGAEMSHLEIAKELAIPRRTISRRLEDILTGLRAHLKEAGFAAAVPLVSPHELGAAILSGCEPAPGLKEQILSRLADAGGAALQSVSRRALVVKAGVGGYVAVVLPRRLPARDLLITLRLNSVTTAPRPPRNPHRGQAQAGLRGCCC